MRHRQELVTGNDWEMTATVIIESMRWKSEKHFPGSLSEFSINQYALGAEDIGAWCTVE